MDLTKKKNYRNRKLLDLAHQMPCQAEFIHECSQYGLVEPPAQYAVEAAHSDSHLYGKGTGIKTHDWAYAAFCHTAHMELTNMSREEHTLEWTRGFIKTQNCLWTNKLIKVSK
tara:strand:- start:236 stop:574 length:339 start_codon:yes stop_codon:yes gene_type:complete